MTAHRGWRAAVSRGVAPRSVSTFCPARGPKAMRYVTAAACSGRRVRACRAVGIRLGQPGLARVFHQHALAREHLYQPGDDGLQQRAQLIVGGRAGLDEGWHTVSATARPSAPGSARGR